MKPESQSFFQNLKHNFPASIVVFLVALPLCLGIALASGAPLFSGLIAGIVGGIVVGALSGSPLGVSGPAAGLTVIVLSAINDLGAFDIFLLAVLLAGAFQIIFGIVRAGVIAYYFPSSVIKGMLTAIGLIIILKQIPHALGYDKNPEGDFAFFQMDGENTFSELINMLNFVSPGAVIIALVSLAILILWEKPFIKKTPFIKLIPGPLVAVLTGIGLNMALTGNPLFGLRADQLVQIPPIDFSDVTSFLTFPDFSQLGNPAIYIAAITIAVVGSIETLLCVEATDKMDPHKRFTPANRELMAQGAGNMVSGLIGGLPITQVIVRSSANIQSGGRTKQSAIMHGMLLLVCALSIPTLLNMIPLATLAAILLIVGYKLAKPVLFKEMYKKGMAQFVPFMVTVVGITFTDLLVGIGIGLAVAIIQILWNNYRIPYHFEKKDVVPGKPIILKLSEDVSFLNKASIQRTLHQMPAGIDLTIDMSKTKIIHPDVLEIIEDFKTIAAEKGINLTIRDTENESKYNPVEVFEEQFMTVQSYNKKKPVLVKSTDTPD